MQALTSYLRTRGIKDGLLRGRRIWTVIGGVAWVVHLIGRMGARRPQVIAREVLQPGQSITISSLEAESSV